MEGRSGVQSPEGDSLFFYERLQNQVSYAPPDNVSVPRRGFIVFLLGTQGDTGVQGDTGAFQSPEGDSLFFYLELLRKWQAEGQNVEDLIGFQSPEGDSLFFYQTFDGAAACGPALFQSPEGDSLFFYVAQIIMEVANPIRFSPPKGIRCFSTWAVPWICGQRRYTSFSPPKGIHCFSTR